MKANLDIRVTRLPGFGKPKFYIKMLDENTGVWSGRKNNYHFMSAANPSNINSV